MRKRHRHRRGQCGHQGPQQRALISRAPRTPGGDASRRAAWAATSPRTWRGWASRCRWSRRWAMMPMAALLRAAPVPRQGSTSRSPARARQPTGTYLAVLDETGEMVSAVSDMRAMDALHAGPSRSARRQRSARADMLVADCNLSVACLAWLCRFLRAAGRAAADRACLGAEGAEASGLHARGAGLRHHAQRAAARRAGGWRHLARLHALGFANVVLHRGREGAVASDGTGDGGRCRRCRSPPLPT